MNRHSLVDLFRSAPGQASCRPTCFWAWNDQLDPVELARQIERLDSGGMGGFMMLGSTGLVAPYLGERWMEAVASAVAQARRRGMHAWIYDEYTWPSGKAGGLNQPGADGQRSVLKAIRAKTANRRAEADDLAVFAAEYPFALIPPGQARARGEDVFVVKAQNIGGIDLLNPANVERFIQVTHEAYARRFGGDFGNVIPGAFTDEPNFGGLPFSPIIRRRFIERWGADLVEHLPALFMDAPDYHAWRYRYWSTVTECFADAYAARIGRWCAGHGLAFTGHFYAEESLHGQLAHAGAVMPHYAHQQVPGIDQLCHQVMTSPQVKQASSVAHQFGRRVISEAFGCTGWETSPQELMFLAGWQMALGVDVFCAHVNLYSLRGPRKHDFPPSYIQQPWWGRANTFWNRLARTTAMLSTGRFVGPILVLHPIGSAWCLYRPDDTEAVQRLDGEFQALADLLLAEHVGFDFGDELIMESRARAEGDRLIVEDAEYRVVVLPPSLTLRSSTVALLERFLTGGGNLVVVGQAPTLIDGADVDVSSVPGSIRPGATADRLGALLALPGVRRAGLQDLPAVLESLCPRPVRVSDSAGREAHTVLLQHRRLHGQEVFFLANLDRRRARELGLSFARPGQPQLWDAQTGSVSLLPFRREGERVLAALSLPPAGNALVVMTRSDTTVPDAASEGGAAAEAAAALTEPAVGSVSDSEILAAKALSGPWSLTAGPNALTLDRARWRVDGGPWRERQPLVFIQDQLAGKDAHVELEFTFQVGSEPVTRAPVWLVLERPEDFRISLGGKPVAWRDDGWWTDPSFRKCSLTGRLQAGANRLNLAVDFVGAPETLARLRLRPGVAASGHPLLGRGYEGTQLASVYLLGEFGVFPAGGEKLRRAPIAGMCEGPGGIFGSARPADWPAGAVISDFVLLDRPRQVVAGDLTTQGLAFFAGSVSLAKTLVARSGRRVLLQLGCPDAAIAVVRINGQEAACLYCHPWSVDLTGFLREGENRLEIELFSDLRNLLGPHHLKDGHPRYGVGSGQVRGRQDWLDPDDPHPWDDDYHFVPFGLEEGHGPPGSGPSGGTA